MRLEFPYLKKSDNFFPVIDIKLKNSKSQITVKTLLDSGATFSVFRSEIADYLGVKIKKGRPVYLEGMNGRILGYMHKIPIFLGGKMYKSKIIFSPELITSFNILGRDDFFKRFTITFHEKSKKTIIRKA